MNISPLRPRREHPSSRFLTGFWSLDISYRPKGENRTAHGLQPWEDVPESIALKGRPSAGHYSHRKKFVESVQLSEAETEHTGYVIVKSNTTPNIGDTIPAR